MLSVAGERWKDEWRRAESGEGVYSDEELDAIARRYTELTPNVQGANLPGAEVVYQRQMDCLMRAIEGQLATRGTLQVSWRGTHRTIPTGGARELFGVLTAGGRHRDVSWRYAIATFEFKSNRFTQDPVLRGQLVRNFMDMAAAQPRRYIFAVSVSAQAQVYAYIYGPSDIWYERLGDLPSTGEWNDSHQRLVRFLLLLYQQLPGDYGFLVPKEGGVYSPFSTNDIPTLVRADGSEAPLDADTETVFVRPTSPIGGRRNHLFGAKSWVYRADVHFPARSPGGDGTGATRDCVVKYNLFVWNRSEVAVHSLAQSMNIPYVPSLLRSATVHVPMDRLTGEILVTEYVGTDIGVHLTHAAWQT